MKRIQAALKNQLECELLKLYGLYHFIFECSQEVICENTKFSRESLPLSLTRLLNLGDRRFQQGFYIIPVNKRTSHFWPGRQLCVITVSSKFNQVCQAPGQQVLTNHYSVNVICLNLLVTKSAEHVSLYQPALSNIDNRNFQTEGALYGVQTYTRSVILPLHFIYKSDALTTRQSCSAITRLFRNMQR